MIHLYLPALPCYAEVHFASLSPSRDKYAACFYSLVAMDHCYSKAIEEAAYHIMGCEAGGQNGAEG